MSASIRKEIRVTVGNYSNLDEYIQAFNKLDQLVAKEFNWHDRDYKISITNCGVGNLVLKVADETGEE